MSTGSSPPQQPLMMSPDGKWVWDGKQWLPVAGDVERHAVFASWKQTADNVEVAVPTPAAVGPVPATAPAPAAPAYVAPPVVQPLDYRAAGITPPWEQVKSHGWHMYAYVGAGLVVVMVGIVLFSSLLPFGLPWLNSGDSGPAKPSPTPTLAARSDYAVADRFVSGYLAPAMTAMSQALNPMKESCNGTMSFSCQDGITATDKQLKNVLSVIDHHPVAPCIAAPVARLRADLSAMDTALQAALKAYADNQRAELQQALGGFAHASQPMQADYERIDAVRAVYCDTQVVGP